MGVAGETVIEFNIAAVVVTVMVLVAEMFPEVAVIVAEPAASPVATTAPLTSTTLGFDELHVTKEVRSLLDPSEKLPVACMATEAVGAIVAVGGVTVRPMSETVCPPEPLPEPDPDELDPDPDPVDWLPPD